MERSALDILLSQEKKLPGEEKSFELKRLGIVLTLKSLSYSRVQELRQQTEFGVHEVLAGVKDPDFRNQAFLDHYGAATPAELVKIFLLPGEIDDICIEIDKLSGYRKATLKEIKKK